MAGKTRTWAEKMETGSPHVTRLAKSFAGVDAGATLLISSPKEVGACLGQWLPPGRTMTVPELRRRLARRHHADATCPLSTGIFLRIVAEHAWDQLEGGADVAAVAPFWRVIDPESPLAAKLRAGPQWIRQRRDAEGKANPV